jgi:hypothetical protein
MNLKKSVLWLSLSLAGGLAWTPFLLGAELNYGQGITVDGDPSEWNLTEDFFSDMYNGGRNQPSWPGYAVLASLYLRYDCEAQMLYALVLDEELDGELVDRRPQDAWLKLYGVGLPGNKLIDGNGDGGTTPRVFQWVYAVPGDPTSMLRGYEAGAQLDEAQYLHFEAHLNVDGATASTGKHAQGNSIPLGVDCTAWNEGQGGGGGGGIVEAGDRVSRMRLLAAMPNPFNPTTNLTVSLAETGHATLTVHDLAGRRVATLLDGLQAAGERVVAFHAGDLPSGTYFAVLRSAQGAQTQKLLLVK